MPQAVFRPSLLALALIGAGVLPASPAAAQVYIYDGPYSPPVRYAMLPPFEVRNIVRGMGYWQVARPQLAGRVYLVSAADEEGPVVLRVDAYTGRVLAARPVVAPPVAVVPRGPLTPPDRVGRPLPPAPPLAGTPVPLPPRRPPEASLAMTVPAVPAPAAPTPSASAPAAPAQVVPAAVPSAPVAPSAPMVPAVAAPAVPPAAAPGPSAPVGPASPAAPAAVSPVSVEPAPAAAGAAPSAAPPAKHPSSPVAAKPQAPKAGTGAGTATPGGAAAGSASVLSRATVEKGAPQD